MGGQDAVFSKVLHPHDYLAILGGPRAAAGNSMVRKQLPFLSTFYPSGCQRCLRLGLLCF